MTKERCTSGIIGDGTRFCVEKVKDKYTIVIVPAGHPVRRKGSPPFVYIPFKLYKDKGEAYKEVARMSIADVSRLGGNSSRSEAKELLIDLYTHPELYEFYKDAREEIKEDRWIVKYLKKVR